jgi:hypothetical protein
MRAIVSIDLHRQPFVVEEISSGHQHYSDPTLSECELKLAFVGWEDPQLELEKATLYLQYLLEDGGASFRCDMVEQGTPICEPRFHGSTLHFIALKGGKAGQLDDDRWVLCSFDENLFEVCLCSEMADLIAPQWPPKMGAHSYDFVNGEVVVSPSGANVSVLCLQTKTLRPYLKLASSEPTLYVDSIFSCGDRVLVRAASSSLPMCILMGSADGGWQCVRSSYELEGPSPIGEPELLSLPVDATFSLQGVMFRPSDAGSNTTHDPPNVMMRLRDPGTRASSALSADVLFWTSKGWVVFDYDCQGYSAQGRQHGRRVKQNLFAADVLSLGRHLIRGKHAAAGRLFLSGVGPLAGMCALECVLSKRNIFASVVVTAALTDLEIFFEEADDRILMHAAGRLDYFPPQWLPPIQHAKKSWLPRSLKGRSEDAQVPVLLCHGLTDSIVPVTQTESFECDVAGKVHKFVVDEGDAGLWDQSRPPSLAFLEAQWSFCQHGTAPSTSAPGHANSKSSLSEPSAQSKAAASTVNTQRKRDVVVAGSVLAMVLVIGLSVYAFARQRNDGRSK